MIAEALLGKARDGDIRAITELTNRVEGKAFQAVGVDLAWEEGLAEELAKARKRAGDTSDEATRDKIKQLQAQLGRSSSPV